MCIDVCMCRGVYGMMCIIMCIQMYISTPDSSPNTLLIGCKFVELSECLYDRLGIMLFGLQLEDLTCTPTKIRTLVNPAEYVFCNQKTIRAVGLVIASDKTSSDLSHADSGKLS